MWQESKVTEWVTSGIASYLYTLRPRQNGRHFPDDISKCIFLNENVWILIKISLKFVPKGSINRILSLVLIKALHRPGDKTLSETMIFRLPMHICNTRPQWVNSQNVMPAIMVSLIIPKTGHLYVFKIWSCRKASCPNWIPAFYLLILMRPSYLYNGNPYIGQKGKQYLKTSYINILYITTCRIMPLKDTLIQNWI